MKWRVQMRAAMTSHSELRNLKILTRFSSNQRFYFDFAIARPDWCMMIKQNGNIKNLHRDSTTVFNNAKKPFEKRHLFK